MLRLNSPQSTLSSGLQAASSQRLTPLGTLIDPYQKAVVKRCKCTAVHAWIMNLHALN
jgi:hypothetical protein